MEIKTKFNVGDKVWLVESHCIYDNIIRKVKIGCIKVEKSKKNLFIEYYDGNKVFIDFEDNNSLFSDKRQAQAECDRRNNETKI